MLNLYKESCFMVVKSLFHTVVTACCNDTLSELDFSCNLHDLPHKCIQTGHQQHSPCYLTPAPGEEASDSRYTDQGSTGAADLACAPLSSLLILTTIRCLGGLSPAVHDSNAAPADCFLNTLYSSVLSLLATLHRPLLGRRKCRVLAWYV